MKQYSQHLLKVAATEPEHVVRKTELDRKVAVGVLISVDETSGRGVVRLLDARGVPTGKIIENVLLLPVDAPTSSTESSDVTIIRARLDNPLNEVFVT